MNDSHQDQPLSAGTVSLRGLALFFLRLGTTAFGGPAAHVAMMEDEVVRRRRWVINEKFLDLLGAANMIPGPSSTEMAIFIGTCVKVGWGCYWAASALLFRQCLWSWH